MCPKATDAHGHDGALGRAWTGCLDAAYLRRRDRWRDEGDLQFRIARKNHSVVRAKPDGLLVPGTHDGVCGTGLEGGVEGALGLFPGVHDN